MHFWLDLTKIERNGERIFKTDILSDAPVMSYYIFVKIIEIANTIYVQKWSTSFLTYYVKYSTYCHFQILAVNLHVYFSSAHVHV